MKRKTMMAAAGGLVATIVMAGALAHGAGGGAGMMQGQGDRGSYGGKGPGMMQGYGGMGPGMMQGYGGMGPGMMQGYGGGPGAGMGGGIGTYESGVLDLSDDQQRRLERIQREGAREHWQLMQEQRQRHQQLMQLQRQGAPDPEALGEAYDRMADAQRRMLEQQARVHQRMREVLTDEQRGRLDQMQRFRWGSDLEE